jgi:hypothetical protein
VTTDHEAEKVEILSREEVRQLIEALAKGSPQGFTEADAELVVDWARETRIDEATLRLLLAGDIYVGVKDGETFYIRADRVAAS